MLYFISRLITRVSSTVDTVILVRHIDRDTVLSSATDLLTIAEFAIIALRVVWDVVDFVIAFVTRVNGTGDAIREYEWV